MSAEPRPERSRIALHASDRPRRPWEHRDWTADAACLGLDLEMFFPAQGSNARAPKAVCKRCPVIDHCLIDALAAPWLEGIWAYTSWRDRVQLRTSLNAKGIAGARLREFAADFGEYVRTLGVDHEQEAP